MLVAGGTAFGEILVWSYFSDLIPENRDAAQACTHSFFQAHDGSIFGIDLLQISITRSSEMSKLLVVSCSDDRTVRLWDILYCGDQRKNMGNINSSPENQLPATADRTLEDVRSNSDRSSQCIANAWAHISRVWNVCFSSNQIRDAQDLRRLRVLTAGEDSTSRLFKLTVQWNNDNKNSLAADLDQMQVFSSHSGKNIWSLAIAKSSDRPFTFATGGADGSCCVETKSCTDLNAQDMPVMQGKWSYNDMLTLTNTKGVEKHHRARIHHASRAPGSSLDVQRTVPLAYWEIEVRSNRKSSWDSDCFKTYSFIGPNRLLLTTQHGKVFFGHISKPSPSAQANFTCQWSNLGSFESLKSYSLVAGISGGGLGFLAGPNGDVLCFQEQAETISPVTRVDGKVTSIFVQDFAHPLLKDGWFASHCLHASSRFIAVFLTVAGNTQALLLLLEVSNEAVVGNANTLALIELETQFLVTSMLLFNRDDHDLGLCVGFCDGRVSKFTVPALNPAATHDDQKLVTSADTRSSHHQDAITSMLWLTSSKFLQSRPPSLVAESYLLTTSRDSTYAIHAYSTNQSEHISQSTIVHRSTLPFGPNIECAHLLQQYPPQSRHQSMPHLILHGFRGTKFVVYNETLRRELLCIEAGGAHRVWAFQPATSLDGEATENMFVWKKAGILNLAAAPTPKYPRIKDGTHGREVGACAVRSRGDGSFADKIVATGAEDTDIRLFSYSPGESDGEAVRMRCARVVRRHNTGIRQLQWSLDGRYLFSCGGCEEFLVWRIRTVPVVGMGVVCVSEMPIKRDMPDLRIMGFEVREISKGTRAKHGLNGDANEATIFRICLGFSNSTVRVGSAVPSASRSLFYKAGIDMHSSTI